MPGANTASTNKAPNPASEYFHFFSVAGEMFCCLVPMNYATPYAARIGMRICTIVRIIDGPRNLLNMGKYLNIGS
jgi:hypothetical protein